ncbi:hypothetical protein QE152_g25237 [Popillia japonica]|uniref:Uncharacterized protein n=1 Tax=Popillia japonica TaxID=7064 RepID=A0AAW1K3E7_POPJA
MISETNATTTSVTENDKTETVAVCGSGSKRKKQQHSPMQDSVLEAVLANLKSVILTIIKEDSYEKDVLFYVQLGEPQMCGASAAADAERKEPDERTEEEKVALLGKPRLGDIVRAQIRIKESKEFKVSSFAD